MLINWVKFYPIPPPPRSRRSRLDFHLNLEECYGEFDDASYHIDQMGEMSPNPSSLTSLGHANPLSSFLLA
jgi:hypothetical protein